MIGSQFADFTQAVSFVNFAMVFQHCSRKEKLSQQKPEGKF